MDTRERQIEIDESAIFRDLGRLRTRGYWDLRGLDVPAVTAVARLIDDANAGNDAIKIERALRAGVDRLGTAEYAEAAALLLGVAPRTRGLRVGERRKKAAAAFGDMAAETFRTRHEKRLLEDLAAHLSNLAVLTPSNRPASRRLGETSSAPKNATDRLRGQQSRETDWGSLNSRTELTTPTGSTAQLTTEIRRLLGRLGSEEGEVNLRRLLDSVEARRQAEVLDVLRHLRRDGAVTWDGEDLTEVTAIRVHLGYERMRLRTPR